MNSGNNGIATDQYDEVVKQVSKMFETYSSHDHLEIEGKVGRYRPYLDGNNSNNSSGNGNNISGGGGTFDSGVSEDWFRKCDELLSRCKTWTNTGNVGIWMTSYDYFLDNNIRVTKTSAGNFFIRKIPVKHIDIMCVDRPYQLRISLKEEVPMELKLPQIPRKVRVKMRKSYVYKNKWRFDLTKVWTGLDEQTAQIQKPKFEIECEFVAPDRKNSAGPDYLYTAASMLQKLFDTLDPQRKFEANNRPKLSLTSITDCRARNNNGSNNTSNSNSNSSNNRNHISQRADSNGHNQRAGSESSNKRIKR